MEQHGLQLPDDAEIKAALDWLDQAACTPGSLWARLEHAQRSYRELTQSPDNLGSDFDVGDLGDDVVASFLAQAKSVIDDPQSYDIALASRTIPWVKQLGRHVDLLDGIPGARERAARMIVSSSVDPGSTLFELVMASNYAMDGFNVEFIDEAKGAAKTPDFKLRADGYSKSIPVECKRLRRGDYEVAERQLQKVLFRQVEEFIEAEGLSVHIDVTYTQELEHVPQGYLRDRLQAALSSRIDTGSSYPWRDEFGYGEVRAANLQAVRHDISDSSLYFGTKLARLLTGKAVRETSYQLAAGADPDARDPRFISQIYYGSVVTWQSLAAEAIAKKSRYVKAKLAEADRQLKGFGPGIAHLAMDVELNCQSSDLRRERNKAAIRGFESESQIMAIYLHYLVPRIAEGHTWLIDETVDRFGMPDADVPTAKIFSESVSLDNDEPAWNQDVPLPRAF